VPGRVLIKALEDVYMFTLLLSVGAKVDEREVLGFW